MNTTHTPRALKGYHGEKNHYCPQNWMKGKLIWLPVRDIFYVWILSSGTHRLFLEIEIVTKEEVNLIIF